MAVTASGITVDSLSIEIKTSAYEASRGIYQLSNSLDRLKTTAGGGCTALSRLTSRLKRLFVQINEVDVDKLTLLRDFFQTTSATFSASATFRDMKKSIDEMAKKMEEAGMGDSEAKEDDGKQDGLKEKAADIKKLGDVAKKATGKFSKFFEQLKRIAVYRLIRTALKKISEALQTGMNNIYEYSLITKGELQPTLDRLAVTMLYWKNSLASVGSEIMQVLAPAIMWLANAFVNVNNSLANMVAMLRGTGYYLKAKKIEEYAGAWAKLNRQLLGFDEINKLSGDTAIPYDDMFEKSDVSKGKAAATLAVITAIGAALAAIKVKTTTLKILKLLFENKSIFSGLGTGSLGALKIGKGVGLSLTKMFASLGVGLKASFATLTASLSASLTSLMVGLKASFISAMAGIKAAGVFVLEGLVSVAPILVAVAAAIAAVMAAIKKTEILKDFLECPDNYSYGNAVTIGNTLGFSDVGSTITGSNRYASQRDLMMAWGESKAEELYVAGYNAAVSSGQQGVGENSSLNGAITGSSGETSIDLILDSSKIGNATLNWKMGQKFRAISNGG